MKTQIIGQSGEKIKDIELPEQFSVAVRSDIIKKVFDAYQFGQPYGAYILAGKKVSASGKQSHARRKWKTLYGKGLSRVPRKTMSRRGTQFYWVGAFIPGTVKGRSAHPPKPFRQEKKINKKEKSFAFASAIAASSSKEIIERKYPKIKINGSLPIVIDSGLIGKKVKDIKPLFEKIFGIELIEKKRMRAGKGRKRGRKYRKSSRIMLITAVNEDAKRFANIIDIVKINQLNISALAPGGVPGRLIVWTEKAIEEMKKK